MNYSLDRKTFQAALLGWFALNRRDLPWRETYDPYQVWISEIMLQQTQMERVIGYFTRWLELFPDVGTLAGATEQSVMKAWEGLGYYSRARNLMKASAMLVDRHDGRLPETYESLLALPGIGPYTAGAIMSIAFDRPRSVIDANVERLFSRLGDIDRPMKEKEVRRKLEELLTNLLQGVSPRAMNQGLMELGALVCTPATPACKECPVNRNCKALAAGTVSARPVKKLKPETIDIVMACVIVEQQGKIFIQQRHNDDVWGGLWEFPGGRLKNGESPAQAARRELYEETEMRAADLLPFAKVVHHYTRYRVTLHSFFSFAEKRAKPKLHAAQQNSWVSLEELAGYAFPSGHRKLVAKLRHRETEEGGGV